jgi:oxygen-independent coproporphyrinogen-3 oxidase
VQALCRELEMRANEINETITSIYLGGGTPSLLSEGELQQLFAQIREHYTVSESAEVTLEANPDDLTESYLNVLRNSPVNRLSIGVQSFFDEDLHWMNRSHSSNTAEEAIRNAQKMGFDNLTIDLMYGVPGLTHERWKANLDKAISLQVNHLSAYCLTVEEKTALHHFVEAQKVAAPNEDQALEQFEIMLDTLSGAGFEHYEISNFAMPGRYALHNTSYWKGEAYIGIGPSAHSYNGTERSWNIANNPLYIRAMEQGIRNMESELLTTENRFNETVMTALRTMWGCDLDALQVHYPEHFASIAMRIEKNVQAGLLLYEGKFLKLSARGKFLADGIAADLFV